MLLYVCTVFVLSEDIVSVRLETFTPLTTVPTAQATTEPWSLGLLYQSGRVLGDHRTLAFGKFVCETGSFFLAKDLRDKADRRAGGHRWLLTEKSGR